MGSFDSLPCELKQYIFGYLSFEEILNVSLICRNFRELSKDLRAKFGTVYRKILPLIGSKHTIMLSQSWLSFLFPSSGYSINNPYPTDLAPYVYTWRFALNHLLFRIIEQNELIQCDVPEQMEFYFTPFGMDSPLAHDDDHRYAVTKAACESFKRIIKNNFAVKAVSIKGFIEPAFSGKQRYVTLIEDLIMFVMKSHISVLSIDAGVSINMDEILDRVAHQSDESVKSLTINGVLDIELEVPRCEEIILKQFPVRTDLFLGHEFHKNLRRLTCPSSVLNSIDLETLNRLEVINIELEGCLDDSILGHLTGKMHALSVHGGLWSKNYPTEIESTLLKLKDKVVLLSINLVQSKPIGFIEALKEFLRDNSALEEMNIEFCRLPRDIWNEIQLLSLKKLVVRVPGILRSDSDCISDYLMSDTISVKELIINADVMKITGIVPLFASCFSEALGKSTELAIQIIGTPYCDHHQGMVCYSCMIKVLESFNNSHRIHLNGHSLTELRHRLEMRMKERKIDFESVEPLVRIQDSDNYLVDYTRFF